MQTEKNLATQFNLVPVERKQKLIRIKRGKHASERESCVGMATGRVRAMFFHTRARPVGQDPKPGPGPFRVPGFFPGPRPAPSGPRGPRLGIGPNSWPNQKKKIKPKFIFAYIKPAFLGPNLFLPTLSLHFWAQSKKKFKPKFIFAYIKPAFLGPIQKKKKKFKHKFIFAYIKPAYSNAIQA